MIHLMKLTLMALGGYRNSLLSGQRVSDHSTHSSPARSAREQQTPLPALSALTAGDSHMSYTNKILVSHTKSASSEQSSTQSHTQTSGAHSSTRGVISDSPDGLPVYSDRSQEKVTQEEVAGRSLAESAHTCTNTYVVSSGGGGGSGGSGGGTVKSTIAEGNRVQNSMLTTTTTTAAAAAAAAGYGELSLPSSHADHAQYESVSAGTGSSAGSSAGFQRESANGRKQQPYAGKEFLVFPIPSGQLAGI